MATSLRERSWEEYKKRLAERMADKKLRVSRSQELAEARMLIERVEARRRAMVKGEPR